jgi:DNA-binding MarR family transcriptional regulator
MRRAKPVQSAHISSRDFRDFHLSLLEIGAALNRPDRDEFLVRAAGIRLERALFPVLISVERVGPVPLVELAQRLGRDYTTVSRQVSRLEEMGLVEREVLADDRRVRKVAITAKGKAMTDRVDAARERLARKVFAEWPRQDVTELMRLMRRLADALDALPPRR